MIKRKYIPKKLTLAGLQDIQRNMPNLRPKLSDPELAQKIGLILKRHGGTKSEFARTATATINHLTKKLNVDNAMRTHIGFVSRRIVNSWRIDLIMHNAETIPLKVFENFCKDGLTTIEEKSAGRKHHADYRVAKLKDDLFQITGMIEKVKENRDLEINKKVQDLSNRTVELQEHRIHELLPEEGGKYLRKLRENIVEIGKGQAFRRAGRN